MIYFIKFINKTLLIFGALIIGINCVQALSFVDEKKGSWNNTNKGTAVWGKSGHGASYRQRATPNGSYYYPPLPYSERSKMVDRRQWEMNRRQDAINVLFSMLNGRTGFDRKKAIQIARTIEATSAYELTDNFHPDAVVTYDSHTSKNIWRNQAAFKNNAKALQNAAKALAEEFDKRPTSKEGTVLLFKSANPFTSSVKEKVAVSADVWNKLNVMLGVCNACHQSFRRFNR